MCRRVVRACVYGRVSSVRRSGFVVHDHRIALLVVLNDDRRSRRSRTRRQHHRHRATDDHVSHHRNVKPVGAQR